MENTAGFWDKIAEKYAKQPIEDEASYEHKLEVTRRYLTPNSNVLEFGCGTGSTALLHTPFVHHILGIDFSKGMIDIAQTKLTNTDINNVSFKQMSIGDSNSDSQYDVIMGMSALHLLSDKDAVIRKIYDLLPEGGAFISSTACLGDFLKLFKIIGPIGRWLGLLPLVKVFTEDELIKSIKNAGFSVEYQWRPGKSKAVFIVAKK